MGSSAPIHRLQPGKIGNQDFKPGNGIPIATERNM
jgi:hypothetical protein